MHSSSILRYGFAAGVFATLGSAARTSDDSDDNPLPIVIWHGLGDNYKSDTMDWIAEVAEEINPGTFVYPIAVAEDPSADQSATFQGNVSAQIEIVCEALARHPILSTAPAIDAIGLSQGGQFLRGYVERCNSPPIRSLVTLGSQHNGVVEFKECRATDWLCRGAMSLLKYNVWSSFVQSRLVPAQYFRDPQDYDNYLEHSAFLADINNERELKNVEYAKNLASLSNFVMWMYEDDDMVFPKETSWFEEVNGTEIIPLRARKIYQEDWIGLRDLDRKGGLRFRSTTGGHLAKFDEILNETLVEYFGLYDRKFVPEKGYMSHSFFESEEL